MKTGVNSEQHFSYSIDCPHCGETTYSDVDINYWCDLEWGDGHPHGSMECPDCKKEFYVVIDNT